MKNKKIIISILILLSFLAANLKSNAITLPWFSISSNNYSNGTKMTLEEKKELEVGESLQLYGMFIYGNDLYNPMYPDGIGRYVKETILSGIIWSSSNNEIATVDETGKVTAKKSGIVTINASTQNKTDSSEYELKIVDKKDIDDYEISLMNLIVGPLWYVAVTDGSIWLNRNGNSGFSDFDDTSYYLKLISNNPRKIIEENLNLDNLTMTSSNDKVLKCEIKDEKVLVHGVSEGKADLALTYLYNGKKYTKITNWIVRPDPTPSFELGCDMAVLLDNSIVELDAQNKKNTKDVSIYFSTLTSDIPEFPEGYNKDNYFICNWKSLNESIVKIDGSSNTNTVKLEAVSPGKTQVQCTIKTATTNETITKIVTVYVRGDSIITSGNTIVDQINNSNNIQIEDKIPSSTNNNTEKTSTVSVANSAEKNSSTESDALPSKNDITKNNTNITETKNDDIIAKSSQIKTDDTIAKDSLPKTGIFFKKLIWISVLIVIVYILIIKFRKAI